ncbi:MAG TPA: peptidase M41, partial [Chryseobacterium sp.]
AWYLPEERQLTTTEQMLDEMCATLGGRAAEEVIFNNISTGALSDLETVTKRAQAMVTIYGLSPNIGNISYYDSSGQSEYSFGKPYSEATASKIDAEIKAIIENQYERAVRILSENKDKLNALANKLLEKEVIFREDLEDIFGKRAWDPELTEKPVTNTIIPILEKEEEKGNDQDLKEGEIQAPESPTQI